MRSNLILLIMANDPLTPYGNRPMATPIFNAVNYGPALHQIAQRNIITKISNKLPRDNSMIDNVEKEADQYVIDHKSNIKMISYEEQALINRLRRAFKSIDASDDLVRSIRAKIRRTNV
jgi:hypothetical protein